MKNGARKLPMDLERLGQDLVALGRDMKAPPEFAAWVIAEYERVFQRPAPPVLAQIGRHDVRGPQRRDLFVIYVPEDRLPIAAPLAVELAKRGISLAFSEYEVESDAQLAATLTLGLSVNLAGVVLVTQDFLRRGLPRPAPDPRLNILDRINPPAVQAEALVSWLSKIPTQNDHFRTEI